ncbi:3-dehydroquinate dehydratase [Pigmentibacter sp. JX0631]|uniref:type II 3-dehydroquinate dehydratase n=1 Tax=Pigmentibacter sp. JX0631 TaxID=2976982 RepID=UPI0024684BAE|nr:type II 3-dehydroquinate dehydratase [Pigmentibacter sp. JX0631]WGL58932.1 3-dehydroquinate dehydratase [Pigmentibacter sp. JX0631]
MNTVLVINGPNLGILGKRQPHIYGSKTLTNILDEMKNLAKEKKIKIEDIQNNVEGEIINFLNEKFLEYCTSKKEVNKKRLIGIIINPAGYTHTSVALRDALEVFKQENIPIYEVHLSNIFAREDFRHKSYISPIANGVVSGLGSYGYIAALQKIFELEENV